MKCSELNKLEKLGDLEVIAGKKGLDREIRWIYFADSLESVQSICNPEVWIDGNELYVLTHSGILNDVDTVVRLMRSANAAKAAGFVMDEEFIKEEYVKCADSLGMPLFKLPRSIRSIDLSQVVCTAIIEEKNAETSIEKLLIQILHSDDISEETAVGSAGMYGINLDRGFRVALFSTSELDGFTKRHGISDKSRISQIMKQYLRKVRESFESACGMRIMAATENNSIIVLLPTDELPSDRIRSVIHRFRTENILYSDLRFNVSIGCEYSSFGSIRNSYSEARRIKDLVDIIGNEDGVLFFDEAGLYMLIFASDNKDYMYSYMQKMLGKLIDYDKSGNTELTKTLNTYLKCSGNGTETAEKLFIHRNTLHYRIEKIEQITGYDLNSYEMISNLVMAFKIKKYFER